MITTFEYGYTVCYLAISCLSVFARTKHFEFKKEIDNVKRNEDAATNQW